jgi:hypothetical protein
MVGPFFEFNDYLDYIHSRGVYKKVPLTFWPTIKLYVVIKGKIFILESNILNSTYFNVYRIQQTNPR